MCSRVVQGGKVAAGVQYGVVNSRMMQSGLIGIMVV